MLQSQYGYPCNIVVSKCVYYSLWQYTLLYLRCVSVAISENARSVRPCNVSFPSVHNPCGSSNVTFLKWPYHLGRLVCDLGLDRPIDVSRRIYVIVLHSLDLLYFPFNNFHQSSSISFKIVNTFLMTTQVVRHASMVERNETISFRGRMHLLKCTGIDYKYRAFSNA